MRDTEERIVFAEECEPGERIRVFVRGEISVVLLDAFANYVERQRRRLAQHNEGVAKSAFGPVEMAGPGVDLWKASQN